MAYIELVDRPKDAVAVEDTEAGGKGKVAKAAAPAAAKSAPKSRKKAAA